MNQLQCCLDVAVLKGLRGQLPDFGYTVASKISTLRISNTSLQQCDATLLAVYKDGLVSGTLRAGSSSDIGTDNTTGCLPDGLLFCEAEQVGDTPLYCPSLAFRRPAQSAFNQLTMVSIERVLVLAKRQERITCTFLHQFYETPSNTPGCPVCCCVWRSTRSTLGACSFYTVSPTAKTGQYWPSTNLLRCGVHASSRYVCLHLRLAAVQHHS